MVDNPWSPSIEAGIFQLPKHVKHIKISAQSPRPKAGKKYQVDDNYFQVTEELYQTRPDRRKSYPSDFSSRLFLQIPVQLLLGNTRTAL